MTGGGYRDEDLQFRPVDNPMSYGREATGPVRYCVVANDDGVIGYLWASETSDAAGYEWVRTAGDNAANAGVYWYRRLREAKTAGLPPQRALRWLTDEPGGPVNGHVVPGSESTMPSLEALRQLARS